MPAVAFSNNDIAVVRLDFSIATSTAVSALQFIKSTSTPITRKRFCRRWRALPTRTKNLKLTTEQAPIQKFWWKDLFAKRGGTYQYRIVPMGGSPGGTLTPLPLVDPLLSNQVTLTPKRPPFNAYFNRGITATQALSHALNDKPSINALAPHILDPTDPIRIRLMGQLSEGVTSLLDRADAGGGTIMRRSTNSTIPRDLKSVCRPIRKAAL